MTAKHHIEQEIKLTAPDEATLYRLLDSKAVQRVFHQNDGPDKQRFIATYYDTPNWALRDLRWSLRTRYEGERHVCTLKRGGKMVDGISSCEEIEHAIEHEFSYVSDVPDGLIANALSDCVDASTPLLPRVKTNMQRSKRILKIGDTLLELVIDSGFIAANNKQYDLYEVEIEQISGDLHTREIQAFVAELTNEFKLDNSIESKHSIGLSLFKNETA